MLKVFLVEDESTIRETLRDTVPWESIGYTFAGEAADGEMALPLITDAHPDVLITDIRMPFMDGLSLSKLVLEEFPETKIIILSGYDDFEYARQAIELGVEQYLLKPVTKASLMKVLREVRDKIEQEREQREYQVQFQHDSQEYDQYARRKFMERVVSGRLPVQQIYEEAAKLDLDIKAQAVDLDGARAGHSENLATVRNILRAVSIPVELGGGIRTMANIDEVLALGVRRVILGSVAVRDPELVKQACKKYGDRIVVGIDAKDGIVAVSSPARAASPSLPRAASGT